MIVGTDVFKVSVLHPKAVRDHAQLHKAEPLVQMTGVDIAFHHGVELQDAKAEPLGVDQTVLHQLLTDMLTAAVLADGIAGVADMTAPTDVVWVKNIQADNPFAVIGYAAIAL